MKIGVLGTGDVGRVLAKGLADRGHEVKLGSRTPQAEAAQGWLKTAGPKASVGTPAETAAHGEIVVLATPWTGTESVIALAGGPSAFAGKIVMDGTNPLDFSKGAPALALGHTDSGGETVQRWLPAAKVVKVFNTVGNVSMVNPSFPAGKPTMFICGEDDGAKKVVDGLVQALGWEPAFDIGPIAGARYLEAMCMLWVSVFMKTGSPHHAFALLRK